MAVYAVVRESDDVIVNSIVWDGAEEWIAPDAHRVHLDSSVQYSIGGTLTSGESYTPPPEIPDE